MGRESSLRWPPRSSTAGVWPTDPAGLQKINAPVLGSFGGQDRGIPPDAVREFEAAMKPLNKKVDLKIFAGYAFENPDNPDGWREADAADAWKRTTDFLAATLKK